MADRPWNFRSALVLGTALAVGAWPVAGAAAPKARASRAASSAKVRPASPRPAASKPAAATLSAVRLEIIPASARLEGARARQRLVVLATDREGATHDVTDRATFSVSAPKLLRVTGGVATPAPGAAQDGEARVVARLGRLASAPAVVTVANPKAPAPVEFVNDVVPILAKAGCNSTACHGSPAGKGGFKLSLFGYEPDLDYVAIAREADGKRIDPKTPERSLLLQKATAQVSHGGGLRLKPGSPEYRTLLQWIASGAPGIGELEARVKEIRVAPDQPWMPAPNTRQRLVVTALMSDGSTRDVTDGALFSSNDDAVAEVDPAGIVTARRPGETAIMIRYLGQVAVARVAVLPPWKPQPMPAERPANYIDELVRAKLQKLRMVPSEPCTDEEFIRRATLDVCGIVPTVEEVREFLADRSPDKRTRLIDRLLARPEHIDLWTLRWNDLLRNNPRVTRLGAGDYARWIREQLEKNRPYNEWVRELLTAQGKNTSVQLDLASLPPQLQRAFAGREEQLRRLNEQPANPAANYFVVSRDPLDATAATSQVFLGVRIDCARCHNHPFERWTQTDFYGLAAFFAGVQVTGNQNAPRLVFMAPNPRRGLLRHPKTNEIVEPRPLDGAELSIAGRDRRAALAEWITSPQNPWFARALVNRIWAHYFGRGIVEPVDDFRATNPPSNEALLDALARDFVAHGFDLRHIHRVILTSRTYQQSSRPNRYNRDDTSNFARFYPKRLMAEQLYDSISQATGVFPNLGGGARRAGGNVLAQALQNALPEEPARRVMQLYAVPGGNGGRGGPTGFLDTFGKPRREVVCECERSAEGNMNQALALINGAEVNARLSARNGRVQQLIRSGRPDPEVVEELYLAALSRFPTPAEQSEALALIRSARTRGEGIEDLMWSLLNSREFLFNH